MALSDDQRAMLRLLAQREQGYEDIAALMGLSVEQVRAKVKEALEEIDSGDVPPAPPAKHAVPAPVEASPPPPPPKVEAPAAAAEPTPLPAARASRPARTSPTPLSKATRSMRRHTTQWVGGALIVALIVLFATGTIDIGGGDGGSDSSTATTTAGGESTAGASSSQVTKAVLAPVAGGEGAGLALFGRIKKTAILQVEAKGLRPTAKGQSYTVWLYRSPRLVLRVGAVAVGKNGAIAAQFPIPAQVLSYVAGGAFDQIDVSRTANSTYEAEVARAKQQKRLPAYTGEDVLRGKITGPAIKKK